MSRDIPKLIEQYKPLILRIYKKFHPMLPNKHDKEDLMSQIYILFTNLVYEYDKKRGVDFPYYIKRMLELRTYHYVTSEIKVKSRETLIEGFTNDEVSFEDMGEFEEEIMPILEAMSWDDEFSMGKKQKRLFIGLLRDHKTLQKLAEEEGVKVSTLHTRLHFLVKKLKEQKALQDERENKEEGF